MTWRILLILPEQNMMIFLASIILFENIWTFWHKNYAWILNIVKKSLWILSIFLVWFLGTKCPNENVKKKKWKCPRRKNVLTRPICILLVTYCSKLRPSCKRDFDSSKLLLIATIGDWFVKFSTALKSLLVFLCRFKFILLLNSYWNYSKISKF